MKNLFFILIFLLLGYHLFAQESQVDQMVFPQVVIVEPNPPKPIKGWELVEKWNHTEDKEISDDLINVPLLVGEYPAKIIKFQFKGNAVGIAVVAIPDAGIIQYSIDGSDWKYQDLYVPASKARLEPLYFTLGKDLKNRRHTLQIRLMEEKNMESTGSKCVIHQFYFNSLQ